MKTIKIDLSKIKPKDLNGTVYPLPNVHSVVGNKIFMHANTLELDRIARELHAGKTAECSAEELSRIIEIVTTLAYYLPFVQNEIMSYLNSLIKNQNNG